MNKDDMNDDAEFDAFLNGEGELARRLQAMPQREPSAELDAAILNRARLAMAQEDHPKAANDPGASVAAPRLAPPFGHRWRVPVGIAATLLAGVFANQAFQEEKPNVTSSMVLEESAAPAPAMMAPPPPPLADNGAAEARKEMNAPAVERSSAPPPLPKPLVVVAPAPAPVVAAVPMAKPAAPALAAAPAPEPASAAAAPPPAVPAPMAPAAPVVAQVEPAPARLRRALAEQDAQPVAAAQEQRVRVEITGSAIKRLDSKAWLREIERLLKLGANEEALQQWQGFREAYPREKVAPELEARLDALDR